MFFSYNATIASIARVTAANRYGEAKRKTVAVNVIAHLRANTSVVRNADGNFSQIDATVYTSVEIKAQDKITFQNGDVYYVFSVDTTNNIHGNIEYYISRLVKEV